MVRIASKLQVVDDDDNDKVRMSVLSDKLSSTGSVTITIQRTQARGAGARAAKHDR